MFNSRLSCWQMSELCSKKDVHLKRTICKVLASMLKGDMAVQAQDLAGVSCKDDSLAGSFQKGKGLGRRDCIPYWRREMITVKKPGNPIDQKKKIYIYHISISYKYISFKSFQCHNVISLISLQCHFLFHFGIRLLQHFEFRRMIINMEPSVTVSLPDISSRVAANWRFARMWSQEMFTNSPPKSLPGRAAMTWKRFTQARNPRATATIADTEGGALHKHLQTYYLSEKKKYDRFINKELNHFLG